MSLQSRLSSLITAVGADIKSLNARAPASTVTVLPGSPVDGQIVNFLADATNGVIWRLRWRAAGGTYKWEYIGGSPLAAERMADETVVSFATNSWGAFNANDPQVTSPLPGDYRVIHTAGLIPVSAASTVGIGLTIGGVAPIGGTNAMMETNTAAGHSVALTQQREIQLLTPGIVVKQGYFQNGGAQNFITRSRRLELIPIRCGAA